MASSPSAGVATGASRQDADLHRRNVQSYDKANGQHVVRLEAEDTKKLQKRQTEGGILQLLDDWEVVIAPIIFTAFALFTRLWKIGLSNIVTWDEAQSVFHSPL
jgi:dolichyl-phosphate-mannose-protein mannosyltransferase